VSTQVFAAKGLYRSPNYVSDVPAGAALVADNLVVPRPDIYETHRGAERLPGVFPDGVDITAMVEFRGVLIAYGAGRLARYSSGTWVQYTGTYLPPDGPLRDSEGEMLPGRVIFHEVGEALYFTTSKGVFRLEDPLSQPELSGVIQALAGVVTLSVGVGTALPPESSVAFRYVWGKRTTKGRLILGAPSGRMVIYNTSTTDAKDVVHAVPVPAEVRDVDGYFLQVYKSQTFPLNVAPDDEMALTYERAVSEMGTGSVFTFSDIDPEPRGAAAYFAPSVGSLQDSKYRPPIATDIITFGGSTVFLNAQGPQSIDLTLLGVGGPNGLQVDDGLIFRFADGTAESYYGATSEGLPGSGTFQVYTTGTPAQNIADTTNSLLRMMNRRTNGKLYGQYLSTDNDFPGQFQVSARTLDQPAIIVRAGQTRPCFAPDLNVLQIPYSVSRSAGVVTVTMFAGYPHGFNVGDTFVWSTNPTDAINFPPGVKTVATVVDSLTFTYNEAGPNAVVALTGSTIIRDVPDVETIASVYSVAWSPLQEPDAAPVLQNAQAGNPDLPVLRALLLDNSLYLLKEDGLFRLSGSTPNTFAVDAYDTTVSFRSPWASWTLGGRAYALTTEGLKVWSESAKPQPASVSIEQDLLDLMGQFPDAVNSLSFVVNYESERRLYLWLPTSNDSVSADAAWVYSYLTDTWTRYVQPANTAIVSPELNRMVIAPPGSPQLLRERKTRTNADFQGPDGEAIPVALEYTAQVGGSPLDSKQWSRFSWHFEAQTPSVVTASYRTEITLDPQVVTIPGSGTASSGILQTLVPPETARSQYLYSRIEHAVAQQPFRLLGYVVRHRNYRQK